MPIRVNLDKYAGNLVVHCHLLTHEDLGMMVNLRVEGNDGTVFRAADELDPTCYRTGLSTLLTTREGECLRATLPTPPALFSLRLALSRMVGAAAVGYVLKRFGLLPDGARSRHRNPPNPCKWRASTPST